MFVSTQNYQIQRDSVTRILVNAPEHELPILQAIHGEPNIYLQDGPSWHCEVDSDEELQRLCNKYGENVVLDYLGGAPSASLKKILKEYEVNLEAKTAKAAAKEAKAAAATTPE